MTRLAIVPALFAAASVVAGCSESSGETAVAAVVAPERKDFRIEEATIDEIQQAILAKEVTTVEVVQRYLARIKAYNGTCVNQPEGLLGAEVTTIPNAGQINALATLNLRPETRKQWGFDDRKARSMTDAVDADPNMPDALEIAAAAG